DRADGATDAAVASFDAQFPDRGVAARYLNPADTIAMQNAETSRLQKDATLVAINAVVVAVANRQRQRRERPHRRIAQTDTERAEAPYRDAINPKILKRDKAVALKWISRRGRRCRLTPGDKDITERATRRRDSESVDAAREREFGRMHAPQIDDLIRAVGRRVITGHRNVRRLRCCAEQRTALDCDAIRHRVIDFDLCVV